MTYTVKREKVEAKMRVEAEKAEQQRMEAEVKGAKLFKRLLGALLIVLAGVFGQALALVPAFLAFLIVFVYISAQVYLWVI